MKLPTLKQCEEAIGEPAAAWEARCYEIACAIVSKKLVPAKSVAVYGHWLGSVAKGSRFDRGSPFVQHGWVILPDMRVLDATRWVFEAKKPYLYIGNADHYNEGGNEWREAMTPDAPEFDLAEGRLVEFSKRVMPSAATWRFVERLLGLEDMLAESHYEPGTMTFNQLAWLANRSPQRLGPHAVAIYQALYALGEEALIPIDNVRMIERTSGARFGGLDGRP